MGVMEMFLGSNPTASIYHGSWAFPVGGSRTYRGSTEEGSFFPSQMSWGPNKGSYKENMLADSQERKKNVTSVPAT
jgi:hypothetical protein